MNTQTAIIPTDQPHALIIPIPDTASKDVKSRLNLYNEWLANIGGDLVDYRDYLMSNDRQTIDRRTGVVMPLPPLSPSSAAAHLATIRARYNAMLTDNGLRDWLYKAAPQDAPNKKDFVDEYLIRLANAVDPKRSAVPTMTQQDKPDDYGRRLTADQANALLAAPQNRRGNTRLMILRDTAIIALMLCTGVREAELCALNVDDLDKRLDGELALHVRKGKGNKSRLIPYGAGDFALTVTRQWLDAAGIEAGAVFRGIYKGGKSVREYTPKISKTETTPEIPEKGRLRVCAINRILKNYPISAEGKQIAVNPHDLRRTYARRLYDATPTPNIMAIKQNLGHADHQTTERYIGKLNASARKPPALYAFDLQRFGKV